MSGAADTDITMNHNNNPHAVMIPAMDIDAGMGGTYAIQGANGHSHDIVLTAQDMMTLLGGGMVTVTSTMGGNQNQHTHDVTVACA